MSWFVPQVGNHCYKGLLYVFHRSPHYIYIVKNVIIVPLVRIRESLMTFSFAKLRGRQTEAPPFLGQFMTFKGSDKSACTLTTTGCLAIAAFISLTSPSEIPCSFMAVISNCLFIVSYAVLKSMVSDVLFTNLRKDLH